MKQLRYTGPNRGHYPIYIQQGNEFLCVSLWADDNRVYGKTPTELPFTAVDGVYIVQGAATFQSTAINNRLKTISLPTREKIEVTWNLMNVIPEKPITLNIVGGQVVTPSEIVPAYVPSSSTTQIRFMVQPDAQKRRILMRLGQQGQWFQNLICEMK